MKLTHKSLRKIIREELSRLVESSAGINVFSDANMEGAGGGALTYNGREIPEAHQIYTVWHDATGEDGTWLYSDRMFEILRDLGVTHVDVSTWDEPDVMRFANDGIVPVDTLCDINLPATADRLWPEDDY